MTPSIAKYLFAAALGAGLFAATAAVSQQKQEQPPGMGSWEDMMKMYEKFNAPGPEHARFKEATGTWQTETKMWFGPGEPMVSGGRSEVEVLWGGRYLKEHYRCDSMMGQAFDGIAILGYDNQKKKYISVWLDSTSTGIMVMEGTRDDATGTTTMHGEYDDPFRGRIKMRNVMREISKDRQIMEMYHTGPDGQEQKAMEISYTRQAS